MKALVGAFNQEKALVGAFSMIVKLVVELMDHFTALVITVIITWQQWRGRVPERGLNGKFWHLAHNGVEGWSIVSGLHCTGADVGLSIWQKRYDWFSNHNVHNISLELFILHIQGCWTGLPLGCNVVTMLWKVSVMFSSVILWYNVKWGYYIKLVKWLKSLFTALLSVRR